jgi:hypothetical protein
MGKKDSISSVLNLLSGATARHNKALREVSDWSGTILKFLTTFELYGSNNVSLILDDIGDAKFDLTAIAYKGRPLIDLSMKIKGYKMAPLVVEIIENVESLRRYLLNPELQSNRVTQAIINLRSLYEKLHDALAEIKFM